MTPGGPQPQHRGDSTFRGFLQPQHRGSVTFRGYVLAFNDDRLEDLCSTVDYDLGPGETVYAHVLDYDDNDAILAPGYWLIIDFQ